MLKAAPALPHGRHIFAYRNVKTNQVVYSLNRVLQNNAALKQLPDLGANRKPTALRKDMWKPLWTLALPESTQNGDAKEPYRQGLEVFRKLREYRKLHELNWTPPPELARPYTAKDIERIQTWLDQRGGSKKETPHDIIARRKKNLRARLVMDQKANSVADLAAILLEQESQGSTMSLTQRREAKQDRLKELEEMFDLASKEAVMKIDEDITKLQETMEGDKAQKRHYHDLTLKKRRAKFAMLQLMQAKAELNGMSTEEKNRHGELLRPIISTLRDLISKLNDGRLEAVRQRIRVLVAETKDLAAQGDALSEEKLVEQYDLHREKAELKLTEKLLKDIDLSADVDKLDLTEPAKLYQCQWSYMDWTLAALQLERGQTPSLTTTLEGTMEQAEKDQAKFEGFSYDSLLESFPVDSLEATHAPAKSTKAGEARNREKRQLKPVFTTEGITVHWENPSDPYFAAEWPENVQHVEMPAVRHRAPDPTVNYEAGSKTPTWVLKKAAKKAEQAQAKTQRSFLKSINSQVETLWRPEARKEKTSA
ncbi:Hypothetical protein R9X50_00483000 [Acrodontium crateriforme]|uniref:Large ribosomal subunit protein mL67 n=1 Tax=Acrodontium crateriforme TaxID=150365 RepID=A0AAQ3M8K1_9PEZI|nr:Hypothetical protein R9X50_00483000 [Acrodontium crateriforme]